MSTARSVSITMSRAAARPRCSPPGVSSTLRGRRARVVHPPSAPLAASGRRSRQDWFGYASSPRAVPRRDVSDKGILLALWHPKVNIAEVVLGGTRPPLLLCVRDMEVVVEIAAERRSPGEAPAHPLLVRLQFRERSPRHRAQRDVVIREVDGGAVEAVGDRRAGRAPGRVVGPEHEVVDEELRAPSEEIGEGCRALVGLEAVLLVNANPGQLLPHPRELVATPRQRLLGL